MKTVECLRREIILNSKNKENRKGQISFEIGLSKLDELFEQAKEMEKQQIIDAYNNGQQIPPFEYAEQYYNEKFKK